MANEEKVEAEVKKEEVKADAKTEAKSPDTAAAKSADSSSTAPARESRPDSRPQNRRPQQRKPYRRFYRRRQKQIVPSYVDWKDVDYLQRFVPERGKIMPRRISGVSAKDQRRIARAIKRARVMALLPYVGD